jgi:hypothetical protein
MPPGTGSNQGPRSHDMNSNEGDIQPLQSVINPWNRDYAAGFEPVDSHQEPTQPFIPINPNLNLTTAPIEDLSFQERKERASTESESAAKEVELQARNAYNNLKELAKKATHRGLQKALEASYLIGSAEIATLTFLGKNSYEFGAYTLELTKEVVTGVIEKTKDAFLDSKAATKQILIAGVETGAAIGVESFALYAGALNKVADVTGNVLAADQKIREGYENLDANISSNLTNRASRLLDNISNHLPSTEVPAVAAIPASNINTSPNLAAAPVLIDAMAPGTPRISQAEASKILQSLLNQIPASARQANVDLTSLLAATTLVATETEAIGIPKMARVYTGIGTAIEWSRGVLAKNTEHIEVCRRNAEIHRRSANMYRGLGERVGNHFQSETLRESSRNAFRAAQDRIKTAFLILSKGRDSWEAFIQELKSDSREARYWTM